MIFLITPLLQGAGDATDLDKTWRGTNKLIAQADKKFKSIAKGIERASVKEWATMAYKVNVQFTPVLLQNSFEHINSEMQFEIKGVEAFFQRQEAIERLAMFMNMFAGVEGVNIPGLMMQMASLLDINIDPRFGQLFTPPPPPEPDTEPIKKSVSMKLDPSQGEWIKYAMAQLLAKEGIQLDLDAIRQAQEFSKNDDEQVKQESGTLPAQDDSYRETDVRSRRRARKNGRLRPR